MIKDRAVGAEVVIAYGKETVVISAMESSVLDTGTLIIPVEVVVLTVNELHTGLAQTVLDIVNITVPSCKTGIVVSALACAVLIEYIPCKLLERIVIVVIDPAGSGCGITLLVEAVVLAVDGVPLEDVLAASEIRRTFVISDTAGGAMPLTGYELTVFFKLIGYIAVVIGGNGSVSGFVEVIPFVIDLNPACISLAAGEVIVLAVDLLKTVLNGADYTADITDLLTVLEDPVVTGRGNRGAPVDNRVTLFAEGSAGVTGLSAGRSLVFDRDSGMNVGRTMISEIDLVDRRKVAIHLGIDMELFVGEGGCAAVGMSDDTLINVHLHILRIEIIGCPIGSCVKTGYLDIIIKVQDANGDLRESSSAGLMILTGAGDGDGSGIGHGLACGSILGGKAVRKYHMIELPMVDIVEVDLSGNRLNGLDRIRLEIHPIDRTERDSVESRVSGNQLQGRSGGAGLDLDNADNDRLVACVIADLKLHAVIAVRYGIAVSAHNAVRVRSVDLNAVDISLRGVGVDTADVIKREGIGAV